MSALQLLLGTVSIVVGTALMLSNSFTVWLRNCFGVADRNEWDSGAALCVLLVLFSGLLFPEQQMLLHLGAITAVLWLLVCLWCATARTWLRGWFGVGYLLAWLGFYWQSTTAQ